MLSNGSGNLFGELANDELAGGGDGELGDTAVAGGVCDSFVLDSTSDE